MWNADTCLNIKYGGVSSPELPGVTVDFPPDPAQPLLKPSYFLLFDTIPEPEFPLPLQILKIPQVLLISIILFPVCFLLPFSHIIFYDSQANTLPALTALQTHPQALPQSQATAENRLNRRRSDHRTEIKAAAR